MVATFIFILSLEQQMVFISSTPRTLVWHRIIEMVISSKNGIYLVMVTKTPLLATLSAEVLLRRCSYNQSKLDELARMPGTTQNFKEE
jgi:hypothetical protein